jgi:hypothetical protein
MSPSWLSTHTSPLRGFQLTVRSCAWAWWPPAAASKAGEDGGVHDAVHRLGSFPLVAYAVSRQALNAF